MQKTRNFSTLSTVNRLTARLLWAGYRLQQGASMVEFDRDSYRDAKAKAAVLMPRIVDPSTRTVRFANLRQLDHALRQTGFRLVDRQAYGPPGGFQLFYLNGLIVVRLKTKGDPQGFRANQPHLSAAVTDGRGSKWENDRGKLTANGRVQAKAVTTAEQFKPIDFQNNPQRFVVILGGKYDGAGQQAWADRTHFPCPADFSDAGVHELPLG